MPDNRRAPLLAYVLAVPVLVAVYAGTFGTRLWAALRPAVATFLGATVIGTIYADEALKRAPATPMRAAAALALAVALVGTGVAPAPALASGDPAQNVIAAARDYLGKPYKLGAEGPKEFDCSGFLFRAFSDAGEAPRISGMRLLARGYLRWFTSRGLFTKDVDKANPGDLVVWNDGEHIGIYLGDGKAISALINPWGITIHPLDWIGQRVTHFLQVKWNDGDGNGDEPPGDEPPGDEPPGDPPPGDEPPGDDPGPGNGGDPPGDGSPGPGNGDNPGAGPGPTDDPGDGTEPDPGPEPPDDPGGGDNPGDNPGTNPETPPDDGLIGNAGDNSGSSSNAVSPRANSYGQPPADTTGTPPDAPTGNQPAGTQNAYSAGTINMRVSADPESRIVGWIYRGQTFRIVRSGKSPSGWLWYQIETASGKQGWIFAHWVRQL